MKKTASHLLTIVAAALLVVVGANFAAHSATGGNLILGKPNRATKATTVKNTGAGPALNLISRGAPLAVSNSRLVPRLNADQVDGRSAADLQTQTRLYRVPEGKTSSFVYAMNGLPRGVYQVSYSLQAGNSGSNFQCWFWTGTEGKYTLFTSAATPSGVGSASASGIVDTRSQSLSFACGSDGGMLTVSAGTSASSQIAFTRVDSLSIGSPGPASRAARSAPSGG